MSHWLCPLAGAHAKDSPISSGGAYEALCVSGAHKCRLSQGRTSLRCRCCGLQHNFGGINFGAGQLCEPGLRLCGPRRRRRVRHQTGQHGPPCVCFNLGKAGLAAPQRVNPKRFALVGPVAAVAAAVAVARYSRAAVAARARPFSSLLRVSASAHALVALVG